jgi:hypothetical protein
MRRPDLAGPLFGQIGQDETVPPSIRSRAIQMAGSLGVNALPEAATQGGPGGPAAAAPAPAPAAAPAPAPATPPETREKAE